MTSTRLRILAFIAFIAIAIVLFIVLQPEDDNEEPTSSLTSPQTSKTTGPEGVHKTERQPKKKPTVPSVDFVDGEPAGGVLQLNVDEGSRVVFQVTSDVPEELHVHGYDISSDVGPGTPAKVSFTADIPGVFEIEMEHGGIPVAELEVTP